MVGWEFNMPAGCGFAGHVTAAAMEEGVLLLTAGWRETIRVIPPLVISEAETELALGAMERALDKAVRTWKGPAPLPRA
jgi:4-aminobutyrate aminotransferase-like enzyme